MAVKYFDLAHLFEQTFGYKTTAFDPQFNPVQGNTDRYRAVTGAYGSPYYASDGLNREYFMPVTLAYQQNGRSAEWVLPYPIIAISSRKTIVETPLTGRRGTVKELINIEDYVIVIKGFIVERNNEFPEQQVGTLRSIYESTGPVSIKNPLTDLFLLRPERNGSDEVVIKELKFPALPGVKHVKPYELQLVSDEPFNLITIK